MEENLDHAASPVWWTAPGETDIFAWLGLVTVFIAILAVMHLYARFDRWAEKQAEETPLATTIPTLLVIALCYELFPLDHFSILLPLAAIAIALARDFMIHQDRHKSGKKPDA